MSSTTTELNPHSFVRWLSWILAAASLLTLGTFVSAHLFEWITVEGTPTPTLWEWLGIALFPLSVLAGCLLGLRWPLAGGILGTAGLLGFYLWHFAGAGRLPTGPYFVLFSLPCLLFLVRGLWKSRLSA